MFWLLTFMYWIRYFWNFRIQTLLEWDILHFLPNLFPFNTRWWIVEIVKILDFPINFFNSNIEMVYFEKKPILGGLGGSGVWLLNISIFWLMIRTNFQLNIDKPLKIIKIRFRKVHHWVNLREILNSTTSKNDFLTKSSYPLFSPYCIYYENKKKIPKNLALKEKFGSK